MNKCARWLGWLALLFWLSGCTPTGKAEVNVFNQGTLTARVTIYNSAAEIAPGKTATYTLTWPGRDSMRVSMVSFPLNQPSRAQYRDLEINHGDELNLSVEFNEL